MLVVVAEYPGRRACHTIESVGKLATRGEGDALSLSSRQETVEKAAEEIVGNSPGSSLEAGEPPEAALWPAYLGLELLEVDLGKVEEGRGWAAGDVVAAKGEDIAEDGKAEGDE